jgi:dTDP-4-dehydrorhamnose 3,5-epimerase
VELNSAAASLYRIQDYGPAPAIEGFDTFELRRFNDDGGSMTELLRTGPDGAEAIPGFRPAQVNYSVLQAGTTKAFHVHRRQTDVWFVPPEYRILLVLVDVRDGSTTSGQVRRVVLGDGNSRIVRIPPGVAHGCRNIGDGPATLIYFTDLHFSPDPADCDEGRLPWDFAGEAVWEITRE